MAEPRIYHPIDRRSDDLERRSGKDAGQHRAGGAPVLEGLVAIAPVVGTARVASAAGNILTP